MKLIYLTIVFLLGLLIDASAQTVKDSTAREDSKIYVYVDQPPVFPGGVIALIKFIQTHIKYPEKEKLLNSGGSVILRFVVDEKGKVTDVTVVRGVNPDFDAEALRIIKMLPDYIPGKSHGKLVKVYQNLPVQFRLR